MAQLELSDPGKEVVSICFLVRDHMREIVPGPGEDLGHGDASRAMVDPYPLRYHSETEGTVERYWIEWQACQLGPVELRSVLAVEVLGCWLTYRLS